MTAKMRGGKARAINKIPRAQGYNSHHPRGSESHPKASINAKVAPAKSSSEPRRPSLLENKKNIEVINAAHLSRFHASDDAGSSLTAIPAFGSPVQILRG